MLRWVLHILKSTNKRENNERNNNTSTSMSGRGSQISLDSAGLFIESQVDDQTLLPELRSSRSALFNRYDSIEEKAVGVAKGYHGEVRKQ